MALTETEELELLELENENALALRSMQNNKGNLSDLTNLSLKQLGQIGGTVIKTLARPSIEFGKGVIRGATFGKFGGERPTEELAGSVVEPEQQKFLRRTARAGEIAGTILPLAISSATGGSALTRLAAIRGAGKIGQTVAEGVGTGMTFEAGKGIVQNRPETETLNEMAKSGIVFGGLSFAGQGLGYLRDVFGRRFAERLANSFINTDRKIAEKLVEQGKLSLGKQFLEKEELHGFKNREEIYNLADKELGKLENQIEFKLQESRELAKTDLRPESGISGIPQLEYKPSTVVNVEPTSESGQAIQPPAIVKKRVYKNKIDFTGTREELEKDVFGVPTRTGKLQEINENVPGLYPPESLGGFTKKVESGFTPEVVPASGLSSLGEATRGLQPLPEFEFKGQRPGTVNLEEVSDSMNKVKSKLDIGTEKASISKIEKMQNDFITRNGKYTDITEAMILKRKLDNLVGDIYLKGYDAKVAVKAEAYENMANELRRQIYNVDPELGELAAKESFLIRLRVGLKSVVAEKGGAAFPFGITSAIVNTLAGSPVSNITAQTLKKTLGKPSVNIAPISRQGFRSIYSNSEIEK